MVGQANEGQTTPEAVREEELARPSLSSSPSGGVSEQHNLRSREDNHARSREEKQQEAMKEPPSAFLEALIPRQGNAWDPPLQRPQSMDGNTFLQKNKSASKPSSKSVPTDQELLGPSRGEALGSQVRLQHDNVQASQTVRKSLDSNRRTQSTRESASRQPPESEPKSSVRQLKIESMPEERRHSSPAITSSMTSGWRNFYAGAKGQSQYAPIGSLHSTDSTDSRNKVHIPDVFRERDSPRSPRSPRSRTKASSSRETPASARSAP